MKNVFKTFAAISLVPVVSAADGYSGCPMGGMMSGGYGQGMMLLGWLTYLLFIALIVAAIYWLIKTANKKK